LILINRVLYTYLRIYLQIWWRSSITN